MEYGKIKHLGRSLSISVLNQVVSSGTNFAIVVYLVRALDKEEFGLYGLGFALILIVAGLVSSLIAVQFVVNLPDQAQDQRRVYAANHAAAIGLLGLSSVGFGALLAWAPFPMQFGAVGLESLLLPITVAATFFAVREFLVRVAYSEREERTAFLSSISVTCAVVLGFGSLTILQAPISAQKAMYIYGGGQLAGALVAFFRLQLPRKGITRIGLRAALRDSWPGGRWNMITSITYNLRTQVHNLLVGPIFGAVALAEVNAAKVLVSPAIMMIPPLTQILLPRLAEKRSQRSVHLFRVALLFIGLLVGIASVYTLALLTGLPWILPLVLGEQYAHVGSLVFAWCAVTLFLATRSGLTIVLQVLRAFRELMSANLLSALTAISASFVLIHYFGVMGAVLAHVLAELVLCIVLIAMIRVWRRSSA